MNELVYLIGVFLVSVVSVHAYRRLNERKRIAMGVDINKLDQREICEGTGIALLVPLWVGILGLFYFKGFSAGLAGWGVLLTVLSFIGFIDDIKPKFVSKIISWKARAVPIALVCLGFAWFFSPSIEWVLPVAVFVAALASFQNTFAGLNGWTGGSGLIISGATAFLLKETALFVPSLVLFAAVLGFLFWNRYPSKVLEGDSGTLLIGAGIAGLLVLSGSPAFMFIGLLFFLPHFTDFFLLKLLTNPKDVSQSRARPYRLLGDGRLDVPLNGKKARLDFAKLVLKVFGPLREWQVVLIIWLAVGLNALLWLKVFRVL